MGLGKMLLPEFDREMANTRRSMERIPEDRFDWKPHEKSMTFVGLATHLANIPSWCVIAIERENFDVAPAGGEPPRREPVASVQEALETFDQHVTEARAAISSADDERLTATWSLLSGGKTVFTMPRITVLRTMVMNHMIHHRAQLGVYLRMADVAVPALYGRSADEAR